MPQPLIDILSHLVLLAYPLTALAQEEEVVYFNPPDWVGWLMFILALVLPALAYIWYRGQGR